MRLSLLVIPAVYVVLFSKLLKKELLSLIGKVLHKTKEGTPTMKKKIVSLSLAMIVVLSLVSCGKDIPTMNEDVSDINSVSLDEIVEDSEFDIDEDSIEEVISDNSTEVVIDDEVVGTLTSSQNTVSSSTPVVEENPEPTPTPHVHQYAESITVQPTCAVAGEKTLTCECGDVRTESIPATGSHNWVEQTTVDAPFTEVRKAQHEAVKRMENVYLAEICDLSQYNELHPQNKKDVAKRLFDLYKNKMMEE